MPAPAELRRRGILPPLRADAARVALSPPRLPASALPDVALARDAAVLALPVHLDVPLAGGRTLLARALHAESGRAGPLVVAEGRCRAFHELPAGASLLVDAETLTRPAVAALESLLDDGAVWLLLGTTADQPLPSRLAPRLDVVTVRVPPLRERTADLPDLARALVAALAARAGRPAPTVTDDAVAHLTSRPWPGDVAELEAVLARAVLRAGPGGVTVQHLLDRIAEPPATSRVRGTHAQLELVVAEMAHELRNPLSTVKAFAQLPGLPENTELRARFAALASDAIARVDDVLENVLAFARLRAPAPADVEVKPLIDTLVAEARPAFAERGVTLDYAPANGARCAGDATQLSYALRNVLAGVAREVPAQDAVRVDAGSPGVVRIDFDDRDGTAARLRRLVLGDDGVATDDRTMLPLPFTLARSVLERNGGALTMAARPDGRVSLEIRLPPAAPKGG